MATTAIEDEPAAVDLDIVERGLVGVGFALVVAANVALGLTALTFVYTLAATAA